MNARLALLLAVLAAPSVFPGAGKAQDIDLSKGGAIDVTAQDGMEWRQNEQMVVANGNARAVRGNVTVTADRLIARYRKKAGADAQTVSTGKPPSAIPGAGGDTGQNEIYRLEAEGNVKIFTATDLAVSDKAVYDIDQAVLLLTGRTMSVTTPQQVVTARDALEYWSQKHMAVARGDATVTTSDNRRVTADTLVAYTQSGPAAPAKPAAQPPTGKERADPLGGSGKLERVEGFGNVEIRTPTEVFKGDRGVYVANTEMARLAGHVRVVRGQNFLDGDEALVNMKSGVYTLSRDKPGARVQGLVLPNEAQGAANGAPGGSSSKGGPSSTPSPRR